MRVLGLLITLGGCALAVASLWAVWARGLPGPMPAPDQDGWSTLSSAGVLIGALGLVAMVKFFTGLSIVGLDDEPAQPAYTDGPGQGRAAAGLAIALVGTLVSLAAGHRRPRRRRYSAPGVPGTTGRSGRSTWKDAPAPRDDST